MADRVAARLQEKLDARALSGLPLLWRGALLALAGVCVGATIFALGASRPAGDGSASDAAREARSDAPPPVLDYAGLRADALELLRASLREADPAVRLGGADALARIQDQPSIAALTELTEDDPDLEVRGHAAEALGVLGARDAAPQLREGEQAAPLPLKVRYASALARLGDDSARKRLYDYAHDKDLMVSLKAALALAEVSAAGDKQALKALAGLIRREGELNNFLPHAGAVLLTKMAALRDARAWQLLHDLLDHSDEGVRLAAAEGLTKLGDDAGKAVLSRVLNNPASPNRLVAAVALIALGEHDGADLISKQLQNQSPEVRALAARPLGNLGERTRVPSLLALTQKDPAWAVRLAAAEAIVNVTGLDSHVLAQGSWDWTRSALASQDQAIRRVAASMLSDLPERDAVPLLAAAISDRDRSVRLAASKSAGKMKTAAAAQQLAAAAIAETDLQVKEQQVAALGEIGRPEARDVLIQISGEPGRIGILAAGALIATGDLAAIGKLNTAMIARAAELRLAAVEAAVTARSAVVIPTLLQGLRDTLLAVRFAAAEGLSFYNQQKALALPILTEALESSDWSILGRALAALARLGEAAVIQRSPEDLVNSADPAQRLAALPVLRALPVGQAVPLLRRLMVDPDPAVKHASVEAIASVATAAPDTAIALYRQLVRDSDEVVRARASGQLALLTVPASAAPQSVAGHAGAPPSGNAANAADNLHVIERAHQAALTASKEASIAHERLRQLVATLRRASATTAAEDEDVDRVRQLKQELQAQPEAIERAIQSINAAIKSAYEVDPARSGAGSKLAHEALSLAATARAEAIQARREAQEGARLAHTFIALWTSDVQRRLDDARLLLELGQLDAAQHSLRKAARQVRASGKKNVILDDLLAKLYEQRADATSDVASKRKFLQRARDAYRQVATMAEGARAQLAAQRLALIEKALAEC
ncbi:MAG: HEAT repeat domain-containing protein [Kofleriaceae bacterium]